MAIKAPFTDLQIAKAPSGFYEGYSLPIALISKTTMVLLVICHMGARISRKRQRRTW